MGPDSCAAKISVGKDTIFFDMAIGECEWGEEDRERLGLGKIPRHESRRKCIFAA